MVNWRAVLAGFVASIVIGLVSGLGLPFTDVSLPVIGAGLAGVLAGGVAGYLNNRSLVSDAFHGALATTLGAVVVTVILTVLGTLVTGFLGLGIGLAALAFIVFTAVPGIVGGAVGGLLHGGDEVETGRPAA
ncbi:DUF5518 domain-containing protein [Halobaculum lipolyticum]|uniref:DUF5518 domain-containing protein n=1 Tax=Halobaculum lipolyticum TaxID=3032001 RepID=A0ABD5W9I1_9EURY|nr:DUF5518 domain-containing protein [Halobaculum sp. DT31]